MSITVELHRKDLAEIQSKPSWLRRLLFRTHETHRFATRIFNIHGGFRWIYDDTHREVDVQTLREIDRAVAAACRARVMRPTAGVEPPS